MKIKNLFSTPKKIFATVGISVLSVSLLGVLSVVSVYAIAESKSVGKETAVNNAYTAAGLSSNEVDAVKAKFKFDDGRFVYDIEFYSEGREYEYKVHSKDGSIIEAEHPNQKPLPENRIGVEKAKNIALEHSGLTASEVSFTKAKFEFDNGSHIYEIEFDTAEKKYKYEIDAINGTVKKTEIKPIFLSDFQPDEEKVISVDEAKKKALEHAGMTSSQASFTKAKLEKENGIYVYEIKFICDGVQFEYDINAINGETVEFSKKEETTEPQPLIGEEAAKKISIEHSGLTAKNVKFTKSELDEENGIFVYEIKFETETVKYEYHIDSLTGDVVKNVSKEIFIPQDKPAPIDPEEAKKIAFDDAGVERPEHPHVFEKDVDENGVKFEIEFSTEKGKFKYEIDGHTGEIREKEFRPMKSPVGDKKISVEDAKKEAVKKFSVSPQDVTFTKVKLENENGIEEYEIDFIYNGKKHEVSVNAFTGEVHEFEID